MHAVRSAELTLVSGDGVHVTDEDGRRYLDGTASLWNVNVGHGRKELADAAAAQMRELATYGAFGAFNNPRARELTDRLADLAPVDDPRIFLTSGGGDSIDTAAKLARRYFAAIGQPERVHLISRSQGYHGTHGLGTSLGGIPANRVDVGPLDPNASQVPARLARGARDRDRARRRRPRGGRVRRAGDRRRRRAPAARRLHRGRRRALQAHRRAARGRRGDRRLRPPRRVVRPRALGHRAGHDHVRQGRHQRLPAARRPRRRAARSRRRSGTSRTRRGSATGRRTRATRRAARSRWPTSTSSSARACSPAGSSSGRDRGRAAAVRVARAGRRGARGHRRARRASA